MPNDLDPVTIKALEGRRGTAAHMRPMAIPQNAPPTVTAGIPGLKMYQDPFLEGTHTGGYIVNAPMTTDAMFLQPNPKTPERGMATIAHEAEHLLAKRQFDTGAPEINRMFDQLSDNPKSKDLRATFVQDAAKAFPYIQEKYGIESAYFNPRMLKFQGPLAPNLAYEQLATLASIEATTGVDLTKDPYLRKNLFKSREVREIYNALTGLRQTRLDAKDLPPHTRIKEKDSGRISDFMESIGGKSYSEGGFVDKPLPGRSKLI
jgi:hypothetical protein